jgi:3-hydroxymyristoyl/3-hydroxydecanoyl-(acyl carrier protein) dehydratase
MTPPDEPREAPEHPAPTALRELCTHDEVTGDGRQVLEIELAVPEDLLYFNGHFEGDPVLPGVVQVNNVALRYVNAAWPSLGRLAGLRRLKFVRVIRPGDRISLRLEQKKNPHQIGFTISRGDTLCTTGTLIFSPRETQ